METCKISWYGTTCGEPADTSLAGTPACQGCAEEKRNQAQQDQARWSEEYCDWDAADFG